MKVLFLQDVPPTARAGDVREVKSGYGRNFLLPRRLATLATERALKQSEELRKEAEIRRQREAETWREIGERLAEAKIVLTARAGPTGRLYGSITQAMVARAVSEESSREISRRQVNLANTIRTTGDHPVRIQLFENVIATITLTVESDLPQEPEEKSVKPPSQEQERGKREAEGASEITPDTRVEGKGEPEKERAD